MFAFCVWTLSLVSVAAIAGAIVAVATALLAQWSIALRAARAATLTSIFIFILFVALVSLAAEAPHLFAAGVHAEPSERARILAQTISEWLNCAFLSIPALLLAAPVWLVAKRHQ